MSELPMPSEVRALAIKELGQAAPKLGSGAGEKEAATVIEPPSVKLIARLFIIPLLIAAAVVGIMLPIAHLAGGPSSLDAAMERLKNPGGERTMSLVGPGAKQRYLYAKALTVAPTTPPWSRLYSIMEASQNRGPTNHRLERAASLRALSCP